jgi:Conserved protein implicated in secretion
MERDEKKLASDIQALAKKGQMGAVRIQARELVRTKNFINKFLTMRAHLNAVLLKIQTVKSHEAMASALKGTSIAMQKMNKQMNLPAMQKIMMEFQKQEMIAEMTGEMIGESMDDMMEGEEDEEETDKLVSQVLDEIGVDLNQSLEEAPMTAPPTGEAAAEPAATTAAAAETNPLGADGGGGGEVPNGGDGGSSVVHLVPHVCDIFTRACRCWFDGFQNLFQ